MAVVKKEGSKSEEINDVEQRMNKLLQNLETILEEQSRGVLSSQVAHPERFTDGKGNRGEPIDRLLRLNEVLELIPVGKSCWWSGVKSGRYPAAVHLGTRITAWKFSEIMKLVNGGASL